VTGDDVRSATFRPALVGYRFSDVDQLLGIVADLLDAEISPSIALAAGRLRRAPWGYSTADVDRCLERLRLATVVSPPPPPTGALPPTMGATPAASTSGRDRATADIPARGERRSLSPAALAVHRLLRERGARVADDDAQRIADYLLAPGRTDSDRTVELRPRTPGPEHSVVISAREVSRAVENALVGTSPKPRTTPLGQAVHATT